MKYKYAVLTIGLLLFFTDKSSAQESYLQIGGGYGFPTSSTQAGENTTFAPNRLPIKTENVDSELGSGFSIMLRAGYMITTNVGADIGLNYLIGNRVNLSRQRLGDETFIMTGQARQARLNPAIVFSTGTQNVLSAYSRVGLVLPLGGVTIIEYNIPSMFSQSGNSEVEVEEIRGRFGIGFSGTLGAQYEIYPRTHIFTEVEAIHLGIRRRSAKTTTFRVDGQDALAGLTTFSRETNFVNELNNLSNNPDLNPTIDQDAPYEALTSTTFFNSIGVNIGIRYRIFRYL